MNKEEIIGMLVALEALPEAGPRRDLEGLGGALPHDLASPGGIQGRQDRGLRAPDRQRGPAPAGELGLQGTRRDRVADGQKLREGKPSIEVTPGSSRQLVIGVWMMEPGEDAIVGERIPRSSAST